MTSAQRFCPSCRRPVAINARFCSSCGHPFIVSGSDETIVSKQPPPGGVPSPAQSVHPPPVSPRRRRRGGLWLWGGFGLLATLGVCASLGLIILWLTSRTLPLRSSVTSDNADFSSGYVLQPVVSGETGPETVEGSTHTDQSLTLALSDGTQVQLPPTDSPVAVSLARAATTVDLARPGLETSGATRLLRFETVPDPANFIPTLIIPAAELGTLDPATVNIARLGDLLINDQVVPDQVAFLPLQQDGAGNIVVKDVLLPRIAAAATALDLAAPTRPGGLAAPLPKQYAHQVAYVPITFQSHLEWQIEPQLVRMLPDASLPEYRRPADPANATDAEQLKKPVVNVVVLVHGHNEEEKDGATPPSAPAPWRVTYKRDAWTLFYQTFLEKYPELSDCTAFYEFIYPTFRPVYSPMAGRELLGESLHRLLASGAANDDHQLQQITGANMPVNLFMVAHSMGGLVARAGLRDLQEPLRSDFQQLVTWGTPHHGSPLVTLAYTLHEEYGVRTRLPLKNLTGGPALKYFLDSALVLDTPGSRELRWDNGMAARPRLLALDKIFTESATRQQEEAYKKYNLIDGTWLYNTNLRAFNETDPYALSDKYTFLYGLTQKRFPDEVNPIAVGAAALPGLMQEANQPMTEYGGHLTADSDGAVPLPSLAGIGIAPTWRTVYLGDADHEEYFGAPADGVFQSPGDARNTSLATLRALGLSAPERCRCGQLKITQPAGEPLDAAATLDVTVRLRWPEQLDPQPGRRVKTTEALVYIDGSKNEYSLGNLAAAADGTLTGSFAAPDLGEGKHQLAARATFADGTTLESAPVSLIPVTSTPTPTATPSPTPTPETAGDWVLQAVIPSHEVSENGPCYFDHQTTIGDGSFASSGGWTDQGCVEGGSASGSVATTCTWSPPPSYLKAGEAVTLTASCHGTAQQTGGDRSMGGGVGIAYTVNPPEDCLTCFMTWSRRIFYLSLNAWTSEYPISASETGSFTVPEGTAGDVLTIVADGTGPGGHGIVVYKYVSGATEPPPARTPPPEPVAAPETPTPTMPPFIATPEPLSPDPQLPTEQDTLDLPASEALQDSEPHPTYGPVTFSRDYDYDFMQPLDPGYEFANGISTLYANWPYDGVIVGVQYEYEWYRNGQLIGSNKNILPNEAGWTFDVYVKDAGAQQPLDPGNYVYRVKINGQPVLSAECVVH